MLEELRRIVQEVNKAPDLEQGLAVIVRRVKQAVGADVCSVYLTDFEARQHVLQASDGLRTEAVGRVRLPLNRGLIGWVSERAEPLDLDDASSHPRYLFVHETGEKRYRGFLGAPIIQNRRVLGVLVLRQRERRHFEDDEVTFVMTLASQLAGAITHARASGELARLQEPGALPNRFLQGLAASPGIAIGMSVVVYPSADLDAVPDRPATDPAAEEAAFRAAVADVMEEIERFAARTATDLRAEDRTLFDAWLLMLESDTLVDGTVDRIRAGSWAPGALRDTIAEHARVFDAMDDPYLRERAADMKDIGRRLLGQMVGQGSHPLQLKFPGILVAREVLPSDMAALDHEKILGIVTEAGEKNSHAVIMAKSLGIPALVGVRGASRIVAPEDSIILDANSGCLFVNPPAHIV
ncbi:MAG: phosphoenolpyruvate-utilizing N-terminal domain-containing protein, partial [Chromatiaceae bacterium]